MTVKQIVDILAQVPGNAILMSNSGWECDETDIGGVWYNAELNEVHLTQGGKYETEYNVQRRYNFKCLYNCEVEG